MHLDQLEIENFRAVKRLSIKFESGANVLVGPNAVGKTTVLEAIRLNKAMLAPRTPQEGLSVLVALGVSSNALPQALNFAAIAGDSTAPVIVNCKYKLTDEDLRTIPDLAGQLSRGIALTQVGIQRAESAQPQAIQFFASPAGQTALSAARQFVTENIPRVVQASSCTLNLTVEPEGQLKGADLFSQILFAVLDSNLSPYKSLFSYFSADRAMPFGDPPIQLGSVDAQQQLESHNSNPSLKFQRFKNTIFSSLIESKDSQEKQNETFKLIFRELLKEKEIADFSVNRFGQASILVKDSRSGSTFDIDALSSGEKGLILTFLILSKSIERGGLILIDEPEIHLNPAVCKDLLPFMVRNYLSPLAIQAIICTHSPEILSSAMRLGECKVYHMRQGGSVSPIRKQDQPEVAQALRLLGTSEVEEMLYDAVVFVEGPDDVEILEAAFPTTLSRIKFRELFGRGEIEKNIRKLQEAERTGNKENVSYFLFDRDRKTTNLASTPKVIVKQWDRYCLENYLIEPEILFDLLRREVRSSKIPSNLGEAITTFSGLAKKQLRELVIGEVYSDLGYEGPGMRDKDRSGKSFEEAADALFRRIEAVRQQLAPLSEGSWKTDFIAKCESVIRQREQEWNTTWINQCNGKQFILDLYAECGLNISPAILKRRLLQENKFGNDGQGTESWKLLSATFKDLIKS